MKIISKSYAFLIITLLTFSGCSHQAPLANPSIPVFGSFAAGTRGFDEIRSDYHPNRTLTEPGSLEGYWLSPSSKLDLNVLLDTELEGARSISKQQQDGTWLDTKVPFTFPEDHFIMTVGTSQKSEQQIIYTFEAAYGTFTIFACDIDGDGIDEILMESGAARGTSVHVRKLTILKKFPEEVNHLAILEVPLNGYIPWQNIAEPLSWRRHYKLVRMSEGFDVVVELVPPEETPAYLASEDYLATLQHPQLQFSYSPKLRSFVIKSEAFKSL